MSTVGTSVDERDYLITPTSKTSDTGSIGSVDTPVSEVRKKRKKKKKKKKSRKSSKSPENTPVKEEGGADASSRGSSPHKKKKKKKKKLTTPRGARVASANLASAGGGGANSGVVSGGISISSSPLYSSPPTTKPLATKSYLLPPSALDTYSSRSGTGGGIVPSANDGTSTSTDPYNYLAYLKGTSSSLQPKEGQDEENESKYYTEFYKANRGSARQLPGLGGSGSASALAISSSGVYVPPSNAQTNPYYSTSSSSSSSFSTTPPSSASSLYRPPSQSHTSAFSKYPSSSSAASSFSSSGLPPPIRTTLYSHPSDLRRPLSPGITPVSSSFSTTTPISPKNGSRVTLPSISTTTPISPNNGSRVILPSIAASSSFSTTPKPGTSGSSQKLSTGTTTVVTTAAPVKYPDSPLVPSKRLHDLDVEFVQLQAELAVLQKREGQLKGLKRTPTKKK